MGNGADTTRLCVRPTCASRAEAGLGYDYAERMVWLEDLSVHAPVPGAWFVCGAHADSLRVPQGWSLVDRRAAAGGPGVATGLLSRMAG